MEIKSSTCTVISTCVVKEASLSYDEVPVCPSCNLSEKICLLPCFHWACAGCLRSRRTSTGGIMCPHCQVVTNGYPAPVPDYLPTFVWRPPSDLSRTSLPTCTSFRGKERCRLWSEEFAPSAKRVREAAPGDPRRGCSLGNEPSNTKTKDECPSNGHVFHDNDNSVNASCRSEDHEFEETVANAILDGFEGQEPQCPLHLGVPLLVFCKTCSVLLCELCKGLGYHSGKKHNTVQLEVGDLSSIAREQHAKTIALTQHFARVDLPKLKVKDLENKTAISVVNQSAKDASDRISMDAADLIQLVETKRDGLLRDIQILRNHRLESLQRQSKTLKSTIEWAECAIMFGKQLQRSPRPHFQTAADCVHTLRQSALYKWSISDHQPQIRRLQHMTCDETALQFVAGPIEEVRQRISENALGSVFIPARAKSISQTAALHHELVGQLHPPIEVGSDGRLLAANVEKTNLQISLYIDGHGSSSMTPGDPRTVPWKSLVKVDEEELRFSFDVQTMPATRKTELHVLHDGKHIKGSPFVINVALMPFTFDQSMSTGMALSDDRLKAHVQSDGGMMLYGSEGFCSGIRKWRFLFNINGSNSPSVPRSCFVGVRGKSERTKQMPDEPGEAAVWGWSANGEAFSSLRCQISRRSVLHSAIQNGDVFLLQLDCTSHTLTLTNQTKNETAKLTNVRSSSKLFPYFLGNGQGASFRLLPLTG